MAKVACAAPTIMSTVNLSQAFTSADSAVAGVSLEELLGALVEAAPVALVIVEDGVIRFVNRASENLFGYVREKLIGKMVESLVPARARARHLADREVYAQHPEPRPMSKGRDLHALRSDGVEIPIEIALKPFRIGSKVLTLAVVVDITERKRLEQRFEVAIEAAPIAMLMLDADGRIVMVNRELESLYGYARHELVGQPVEILVPERFHIRDKHERARYFGSTVARRIGAGRQEFRGLRKDGTEIPIEIGLSTVPSEQGPIKLITVVDVSEQKRWEAAIQRSSEELEARVQERTAELARANSDKEILLAHLESKRRELERLSREDSLTGLANRRAFDERLSDEIRRAERLATPLAVAMLDLDLFKQVNDTFGHAVGDAVLRETANLMRHECRAIDAIARYGGEEFALALPGSDLHAGITLCERIRKAFCTFDWSRIAPGLGVRISAGVSVWRRGLIGTDLLAEADKNLYEAKRQGRNRVLPAP